MTLSTKLIGSYWWRKSLKTAYKYIVSFFYKRLSNFLKELGIVAFSKHYSNRSKQGICGGTIFSGRLIHSWCCREFMATGRCMQDWLKINYRAYVHGDELVHHLCVFNSFGATMEVYGTEQWAILGFSTQTILVQTIHYWRLVFSWEFLTVKKYIIYQ